MQELIDRILTLEAKSQVLEPTENLRNKDLSKISNYANAFLNGLAEAKTFVNSEEMPDRFDITGRPQSIEEILSIYKQEIADKGINAASGGHLGYIPGGGIFASALGDFLADVTNEYAGIFYASPGAVAVETSLIEWIKNLFSYPSDAVGNLASGGSIANLIALTAARDKHGIKGERITKSVVYLSAQTHHCVTKALRIIGLEDLVLRTLPIDERSKIRSEALAETIRKDRELGLNPFLVVGSAGTTDTGAVDPLFEIGTICKEENLWFHVDAAYGGFFIMAASVKNLFKGIELSDSLVVDPHKGLFLPYGIGAVLVKDRDAVFHSNRAGADYMQDAYRDDLPVNPSDLGPELTKHFRGMRMWLPLQLYGTKPFAACLEEKLALTKYIRIKLKNLGFNLGPEPDLSVTYFWMDRGADSDVFNQHLLKLIHDDGSSYFSSTLIEGKFVIRSAILSFRTRISSVDRAIALISECLAKTRKHFDETS
jgi:glutamate/tyrosine decarboxylase-like PLP-dependent enzyme